MPGTTPPRKRNVKTAVDLFERGSKPPERVVSLCLDGDLQVKLDAATAVLVQAVADLNEASGGPQPMGGETEELAAARAVANDAQAVVDAITAEMKGSVLEFHLRGLVGDEPEDLLVAHPPREDDEDDHKAGYNVKAVALAYVIAGCVSPRKTPAQWAKFWATLTPYQRRQLTNAVDELTHAEGTSVPFL